MGRFVRGDVVVIPFPFSDLSAAKRRPSLVITDLPGDDVILRQITSRAVSNNNAISLSTGDFADGSLRQKSNIRPDRLFTADSHIILYRVGGLKPTKMQEVVAKIIQIVSA